MTKLLYFVELDTTTHELISPLNLLISGPTEELFFDLSASWIDVFDFTTERRESILETRSSISVDLQHISASSSMVMPFKLLMVVQILNKSVSTWLYSITFPTLVKSFLCICLDICLGPVLHCPDQ